MTTKHYMALGVFLTGIGLLLFACLSSFGDDGRMAVGILSALLILGAGSVALED